MNTMRPRIVLPAVVLTVAMQVPSLFARDPQPLPAGATTRWTVSAPQEIVRYVAFDPALVERRLLPGVRFSRLDDLAEGGQRWAIEFLRQHPTCGHWGVSFVEILRAGEFSIDGRSPRWLRDASSDAAVAVWFARLAATAATAEWGPEPAYLALEFLVPDRDFVGFMQAKGYPATYGEVSLKRNARGIWQGGIVIHRGQSGALQVSARCRPEGPISGGAQAAGMQNIVAPTSVSRDAQTRGASTKASPVAAGLLRVSFAGHREQACGQGSPWRLHGTHPLATSIPLGAPSYQYGYQLIGGTYPG